MKKLFLILCVLASPAQSQNIPDIKYLSQFANVTKGRNARAPMSMTEFMERYGSKVRKTDEVERYSKKISRYYLHWNDSTAEYFWKVGFRDGHVVTHYFVAKYKSHQNISSQEIGFEIADHIMPFKDYSGLHGSQNAYKKLVRSLRARDKSGKLDIRKINYPDLFVSWDSIAQHELKRDVPLEFEDFGVTNSFEALITFSGANHSTIDFHKGKALVVIKEYWPAAWGYLSIDELIEEILK